MAWWFNPEWPILQDLTIPVQAEIQRFYSNAFGNINEDRLNWWFCF
ncbi:hypothetical protein NTG1052_440017 [Candidatus Nitrotoga sp. 1052]|nr:hypothetical protein NTG1052_440017 [Candidatus Nitrotoga sp. 1052]